MQPFGTDMGAVLELAVYHTVSMCSKGLKAGLVPRLPMVVLAMGFVLLSFLSLVCGTALY
jgi:hypothetical protein